MHVLLPAGKMGIVAPAPCLARLISYEARLLLLFPAGPRRRRLRIPALFLCDVVPAGERADLAHLRYRQISRPQGLEPSPGIYSADIRPARRVAWRNGRAALLSA